MKSFYIISLFALLPLYEIAPRASAQVAIVTHKSVNTPVLNTQELLDIFSLEENRWPDGGRIIPVDIKGKNEIKSIFYRYLGRPANDIKRDRLRIILAGDGKPPITLKTIEETLQKISTTPGAIGYLPLSVASNEQVNVIYIIQK